MTTPTGTTEWLTRRQAADRAGVHLRTVATWLSTGVLTRHRVGVNGVRVDAAEVDALLTPTPQCTDHARTA